jgi:hypothetical protein
MSREQRGSVQRVSSKSLALLACCRKHGPRVHDPAAVRQELTSAALVVAGVGDLLLPHSDRGWLVSFSSALPGVRAV